MSKWTKIPTVNDIPSSKKNSKIADRKAKNIIRNTKKLSYDDLVKENLALYDMKQAKEDSLLAAYEDKRLKSKELIKEAHKLKMQKNNKDNKEKV